MLNAEKMATKRLTYCSNVFNNSTNNTVHFHKPILPSQLLVKTGSREYWIYWIEQSMTF